MFGKTYKNILWYVHNLFLAYFHKLPIIIYRNSLYKVYAEFKPISYDKRLSSKLLNKLFIQTHP